MIRVYYTDTKPLENPETFERIFEALPGYRREKIEKLKLGRDRNLSAAAGFLLMRAAEDAGLDACEKIETNVYGKPFFAGRPDIDFSLSHSGEMALCAIADVPVGCDIEKTGRNRMAVAERFFTPEEKEILKSVKDADLRNEEFYRLWTLKESFIKCRGLGISLALDSFSVTADDNGFCARMNGILQNNIFVERKYADGYSAALCMETSDPEYKNPDEYRMVI